MTHFLSISSKELTQNADDYRLNETISERLYKGTFAPLGLLCAIKKKDLSELELELEENELQMDRLTSHPNLIKQLAHFMQPDPISSRAKIWFIYPYSPYGSMAELCKPYGLPESIIGFVLEDILQAVHYLHDNDIIHRAISGSHILMFDDAHRHRKFVLTGLKHSYNAKDSSQVFDYPKAAPNILKYLAPEILEQNTIGYNYKTDIYAIGIACCEMANGVLPFDNLTADQLLFYKIIGDIPEPLDKNSEEVKAIKQYLDRIDSSLAPKYQEYCHRQFSNDFCRFVKFDCLASGPTRRSTAAQLLEHPFMRMNQKKNGSQRKQLLEKLKKR